MSSDIREIINVFRKSYGKGEVERWDDRVSGHCLKHSAAMGTIGKLYHARISYLGGWGEVVAMFNSHLDNDYHTLWHLIFDVIGNSEEHRNLVLGSKVLACGLWWANSITGSPVFLTIRGK